MASCSSCGAEWSGNTSCTDQFHQLLFWEFDSDLFELHHLMVLCYHIQHPQLLSGQALETAKWQLAAFVDDGVTPDQMRKMLLNRLASQPSSVKVTSTNRDYGQHDSSITWSMTVFDVVSAGSEGYYASVKEWSRSILHTLRRIDKPTGKPNG